MSRDIKHLIKHSSVYSLAGMLSKAIGFLMIPVYTRFLLPADYGILEMMDLTLYVLGMVVSFSLSGSLTRFYYDYKDEAERRDLVSTALLFVGGASLAVSLVLFPCSGLLSQAYFDTGDYAPYFRLIVVTLFFQMITEYGLTYLRIGHRSSEYAVFLLAKLVMGLGLNILFVVHLRQGAMGVLWGGLISTSLTGVFIFARSLRETRISFSMPKLRKMLSFGFPLIFTTLSTFAINFSDRYFLNHYATLDQVGIYSLGYKMSMLVSVLVTGPFLSAWSPKRFELAGSDPEKLAKVSNQVFTWFCFTVMAVGLGLAVFIGEILQVMATPPYYAAARFVPLIVLGYLCNALYYFFDFGIYQKKKTVYMAYILVSGAGVNLALNWLLISRFQAMGAACATTGTFLYVAAVTYVVSQRLYPLRFDFKRVALMALWAGALFAISGRMEIGNMVAAIAVDAALWLLFPAGLYFLGFFRPEEKAAVSELLTRWKPNRQ